MVHHKHDWENIEKSGNSKQYIEYLDAVTAQAEMKRYKNMSYKLLNIENGSSILDLGCGTGDDVLILGELVGPSGKVVGLDNSKSLIEEANQRSRHMELPCLPESGSVGPPEVSLSTPYHRTPISTWTRSSWERHL